MSNCLHESLRKYFTEDQLEMLTNTRVGIAGAGGLGSNVAMMLGRCGIEKMLIVDDDVVEASNLNRQHYWPRHVGQSKIEALAQNLMELNPNMNLGLLPTRLTQQNLPGILAACSIWVEALDEAQTKKMFVDNALALGCHVASASGLCGFGGNPMQKKRLGNLVMVGDFKTGIEKAPPLAPRVNQAAALLADAVLEFILN